MDANERHELKDNDLAEFLNNFGEWWTKHGNTALFIVTAALVIFVGYRFYNQKQSQDMENAWADLAATSYPNSYRGLAEDYANYPAVRAQALLRGAELFHKQAAKLVLEENAQDTGGTGDAGDQTGGQTGVMSVQESLDSAQAMYQQVLDSDSLPVFRANAALGLANVAETRGDWDAAAEYWALAKQLAEQARLDAIATQAQIRMDMLDSLKRPIIFGEPEPQTSAAAQTVTDETVATTDSVDDTPTAVPATAIPSP